MANGPNIFQMFLVSFVLSYRLILLCFFSSGFDFDFLSTGLLVETLAAKNV